MKIAFFAHHPNFIKDIADKLSENHDIHFFQGKNMEKLLDWADVAWFEFCDDLIIEATKLPKTCRIICRLHSYEVFTNLPTQVNWDKVDNLVFVAYHVMDFFKTYFPYKPKMQIIHNGVNLEKFTIPENKKYGKKIASVGYINYKKNPGLLLHAFQKVHFYNPEYSLHIAGQFQDPRIEFYMKFYAKKYAIPLIFEGWQDDMPKWLEDKDFILSTSYWESFHFSIAEGMASGVFPLIHCWPGADTIYPSKYLFGSPDDCLELVQRLEKQDLPVWAKENRGFISRYDLSKTVDSITELLEGPESPSAKKKAEAVPEGPTGITLSMIVRDEEMGIARAINSVKDLVDDIVILVDTKTTDKTALIAEACGARVFPYEWIDNFSDARNTAMSHVKTDWVLVLDGHEYIDGNIDLIKRTLKEFPDAEGIDIAVRMENKKVHHHTRLHRTKGSKWENAVHNVLYTGGLTVCIKDTDPEGNPIVFVQHDRYGGQSEESRANRNKQRDEMLVRVLTKKIKKNEKDTRSIFYLAQQHRDAQRWEEALKYYKLYNEVEGGNQWPEESFQAYYESGRAALTLGKLDLGLEQAKKASKRLPHRAEGWALCADFHYQKHNWKEAYKYFKKAGQCPPPMDARLWVDQELHTGGWKSPDAMSMCCWHLGKYDEGIQICRQLLANKTLPEGHRPRIEKNLGWHQRRAQQEDFDVVGYWDKRYSNGGTSGDGSYGRLAEYKALIINELVKEAKAKSIMDHGCGDGNQASLFECEEYVGLETSSEALKKCEDRFNGDSDRKFYLYDKAPETKADIAVSIDVICHLTNDEEYEKYMKNLFDSAEKCVVIYSTNENAHRNLHIQHREFIPWIWNNTKEWQLVNTLENPYPYDEQDPKNTSLSNFFIFSKS